MLTLQDLKDFGANTADGLGRCLNNETFYLRLVGMALSDANFERLNEALAAGELKTAFEAAHALKGVLGNLSLTPLYEPASELTELLRMSKPGDYAGLCQQLLAGRDQLRAL